MRSLSRNFASLLLAAAFTVPLMCTGCTVHAGYYDPYYRDYHPISGEVVFYSNWEQTTHRSHVELKDRNKDEQKEYWDWRHRQGDHH